MKNYLLIGMAVLAISCTKEKEDAPTPTGTDFSAGVFITNEGMFSSGSGSLSWYNPVSREMEQGVFESKNGFPLGSIVHSMYRQGNRGYVVSNNSGMVDVIALNNAASLGTITNLQSPRYVYGCDATTLLVSDWVSNSVKVVDATNFATVHSIPAGEGPEQMVWAANQVWVANSGGFGRDSVLTIISNPCGSNATTSSLVVGDNPGSLVLDANGMLWVLCSGYADWSNPSLDTPGKLVQINPNTQTVLQSINLAGHPGKLAVSGDGNTLYFLTSLYGGNLMTMEVNGTTPNELVAGNFYGLGVDPVRDEIYVSDALSFAENGVIYRYNTQGTLIHQFQGGIVPGNFSF